MIIQERPFSFVRPRESSDQNNGALVNKAIWYPDGHVIKYILSLFDSADFAAKVLHTALALECIPLIHGGAIIHILMTVTAAGTNMFVCNGRGQHRSPLHKQLCKVTGNRSRKRKSLDCRKGR